jgi:hypothetical protein
MRALEHEMPALAHVVPVLVLEGRRTEKVQ